MIDVLWMRAVATVEYDKRTGRKQPMHNGLARWDQGPINTFVLRGPRHPRDPRLVLIDKALGASTGSHPAPLAVGSRRRPTPRR